MTRATTAVLRAAARLAAADIATCDRSHRSHRSADGSYFGCDSICRLARRVLRDCRAALKDAGLACGQPKEAK